MTHATCRLTAKNRDQLGNPTLGSQVWATFTFYIEAAGCCGWWQASLCMKNLDGAAENVVAEQRKLDEAGERCVEAAVKAFQELAAAVDRRRDDLVAAVRRIRDDKKRVLREQLDIIETERRRVRADCDGLQASASITHRSLAP